MVQPPARNPAWRIARIALVAALALGAFTSPPAQAAVLFGSDLTVPPPAPPATPCNPAQVTDACTNVGIAYHTGNALPARAPVSGVITSVRYRSSTPDVATLRLARRDASGNATGVGTGPTVTLVGSGNAEPVPAQLRVRAGDYLAGDGTQGSSVNCTAAAGGLVHVFLPPLVNGAAVRAPNGTRPNCELLVQATVERDIDSDGRGDETQDLDDDADAVPDVMDNCPRIANPPQNDFDKDGLGNICDPTPGRRGLEDLPAPQLGKVANIAPVKGTVLVAVPAEDSAAGDARASQKGLEFVPLEEARQIPVGAFLDTTKGAVRLRSAASSTGKTQEGDFEKGLFQVLQSGKSKGLTDLVLKGGSFSRSRCTVKAKRSLADASARKLRKRRVRRLRGNAKGRFRTRGRYSSATVRGTVWETTDRCDGTLTKVTRGSVAVRDKRRRKTVVVRAGKRTRGRGGGKGSYFARARG